MNWKIKFFCLLIVLVFSGCTENEPGVYKEEYFSSTYNEARKKFIEAAVDSDATIERLENPYRGQNGEPLYTDVALFGPADSKNILVLISGTHGVEGFAGSGIQNGLLREEIISELPPDTSVIMVHGLNPYGFAHIRRFDGNNIDPNRNFTNYTNEDNKNNAYEKLKEYISPPSVSLTSNIRSLYKLLEYGFKNSFTELRKAVSAGQYSHPEGLFYGGDSKGWSHRALEYIASEYLSEAEHIIVLDFHTGLGGYGECEVITNECIDSSVYKRAKAIWGDKVRTTHSGDSVSIHLKNTLKLALPGIIGREREVTVVSPEFGTQPPLKVFWALRSENWLYNHGEKDHPKAAKIKGKLLEAFYPDDPDWRLSVWEHGRGVTEEALAAFEGRR